MLPWRRSPCSLRGGRTQRAQPLRQALQGRPAGGWPVRLLEPFDDAIDHMGVANQGGQLPGAKPGKHTLK